MNACKRLTVLLDTDDLACLEAGCPEALDGTLLVFDPDLHVSLQDRGLAHLTPWDIVADDELPAVQRFEAAVWQFWQDHAHAVYRGVDLLQQPPFRHMECYTRLAWVAYVLGRALETLRPNEVVAFDERSGHGLWQPLSYRKMPLLFALLRGMAEQANVATRLLSRAVLLGLDGFQDLAATGARPPPQASLSVEEQLAGRPYLLFYGHHVDLLHQLPLIRALLQRDGLAVAQMYKSAAPAIVRTLHETGHLVWHESQVASSAPPTLDSAWRRQVRAQFEAARRGASGPLRAIFANPYMDIHFDFIFGDYLRKLAWHVDTWTAFFSCHRPAMLILSDRVPLGEVAFRLGIPCLTTSHGLMIGETRWAKTMLPLIGALSELHRAKLLDAGVPPSDVRVTGSPALDRLVDKAPPDTATTATPGGERVRRQLGIANDRRLILFCSSNLGMLSKYSRLPGVNWARAVVCVEQLGALARRHPEWTFVFKCHPRYDHPHLYERLTRGLPAEGNLKVVVDRSIDDLAAASDVVVFPNGLSSTLVETSFWHRPVLILTQSLPWYDAEAWGTERWRHVGSLTALETELRRMFDDPRWYGQCAAETRRALHYYLGAESARSIPRCLEVVEDALVACPASSRASRV